MATARVDGFPWHIGLAGAVVSTVAAFSIWVAHDKEGIDCLKT